MAITINFTITPPPPPHHPKVLIVGDGDLSFSATFAADWESRRGSDVKLLATVLESSKEALCDITETTDLTIQGYHKY